jgi:hypothetical protein
MWMGKGLRKLERNRIYVQLVVDAFRSGKRFIFAGSTVEKVAHIQKCTLPNTVYRGESTFGGSCEMYSARRYRMVAYFVAAAISTYARDVARIMRNDLTRRARGWIRMPTFTGHPGPAAARTTQPQT